MNDPVPTQDMKPKEKMSFFKKLHSYLKNFYWKETVAAFGFTIFLLVFEFYYLNPEYHNYIDLLRVETGLLDQTFFKLAEGVFIAIGVTALFIRASFVSSYRFKIIYFILFSFIMLIEYGYQNANAHFMTLLDLQTALMTPESWDKAIPAFMNWLALFPIGLYLLLLLVSTRSSNKFGGTSFVSVLLVILATNISILLYTELNPLESSVRVFAAGPTISVQAFFRTIISDAVEQLLAYQGSRNTIHFSSTTMPQNNIILIIDESVRYDHLSINGYHRSTTPYLEKLAAEKMFHNWGVATAGATCSYNSVALLLTGLTILPDKTYQLKQMPTIFQYAKAMNYKTYYLDGESKTLRFPLTMADSQYLDKYFTLIEFGDDYETDFRMADKAADLLHQSRGNFMVIFKRGVHYPYNEDFPMEKTIWTPILPEGVAFSENKALMINSYDNAIKYNLDAFFQRLFSAPDLLKQTIVLYTSDHAQTLGEGPRNSPHCGETKNEAAVPLLMLMKTDTSLDVKYKAAHRNIFATLLDLMDVPASARSYSYPLSLLKAKASDSEPRYYYYGALFGFSNYKWEPFD